MFDAWCSPRISEFGSLFVRVGENEVTTDGAQIMAAIAAANSIVTNDLFVPEHNIAARRPVLLVGVVPRGLMML